ncbi:hypothetical protein [Lacticaseibacillus nasuensis]|uniref:hypothetical protein n=1 Tax=Lacticaseibacillus nasuensis TaxID=944671 RepID=UPI000B1A3FFB|nr:hypothetical protein [Lacticaseibacillus nasuensis]
MPKWTPIKGHKGLFTYKTDGGVRYAARRTYTDSLGRRHEWSSAGLKQWREADQALKQFEADLANGKAGPIENPGITVSQYHDCLVERKIDLGIWQESTRATQQNYYNKYVAPLLAACACLKSSEASTRHTLTGWRRNTVWLQAPSRRSTVYEKYHE